MNANLVTAEQLLKVEAIVTGLRELDATDEGHQALVMAQAGFTHPDDL
ncbi:hypothetical protein [Amycolatopsis sp. BJA-103]|nr:hypothetical protein [Amycolatopsis sp. BJA-103]